MRTGRHMCSVHALRGSRPSKRRVQRQEEVHLMFSEAFHKRRSSTCHTRTRVSEKKMFAHSDERP